MPPNPTSITAYNQEVRSGAIPTQNKIILDLLMELAEPTSNRMLASILGWETGTVSARITGLMDSGLVKKSHYDICRAPIKGNRKPKRVRYIEIVWPQPEQRKFSW